MKTVQIIKNVKVQKNNLVVGDYIESELNDTQYNITVTKIIEKINGLTLVDGIVAK